MASRGKGARNKGAQYERDIAKWLSTATRYEFKRGLGQTRQGGLEVADVYCEELKDQFHIEVKRQKNCSIKGAVAQALNDCTVDGQYKMPIVITKDDQKPALVTMLASDWILLFHSWLETD